MLKNNQVRDGRVHRLITLNPCHYNVSDEGFRLIFNPVPHFAPSQIVSSSIFTCLYTTLDIMKKLIVVQLKHIIPIGSTVPFLTIFYIRVSISNG